jgi:hypothetical protein
LICYNFKIFGLDVFKIYQYVICRQFNLPDVFALKHYAYAALFP